MQIFCCDIAVREGETRGEYYFDLAYRKLLIPAYFYRNLLYRLFKINRILNECDSLIIFPAQDPKSYLIKNKKSLTAVHDLMHIYEKKYPELSSSKIRNYHYKNICKYSSNILVDSTVGEKHVRDNFLLEFTKVHILPFCIPEFILYENVDPSELTGDVVKLKDEKFIFYPAQFWHHKNHRNLISAFEIISENVTDLYLVLSGANKNASYEIFNKINSSPYKDRIKVLGYVDQRNLSWLYQNCHVFVMASFCGPTNIPPLEAMYFGAPLCISNVYAMPEQCGNAAVYFNPNSSREMANAILFLSEERQNQNYRRLSKIESFKNNFSKFNYKFGEILNDL